MNREEKLRLVLDLVQKHGITAYEIGENTPLNTSGVHRILNGEIKKPREKTLTTILEYIESRIVGTDIPKTPEVVSGLPAISQDRGAPYYDVDFIGGFDMIFNEQKIAPTFYIDFPPYNDADAWINVTGKSMSPYISHGDIAAIKRLDNWMEFIPFGEIYAVVTDEHRTIKTVTAGKDDDHFTLVPHNQSREYVEQQIPKKIINHMYRVKGTIKKFF